MSYTSSIKSLILTLGIIQEIYLFITLSKSIKEKNKDQPILST